ncbi:hypothetical protein ANCCEY_02499 [Ancylostoma ceylanicum]|uniref:Uncharacterized protein n=1 Tax=Ancylostoma ceylanicum TaxID=53326 RepID=A0A0D6M4M3_9BILA|nr:hypothetical protein ANCCEY_02499 [Ancylostoma ceylanicum]
MLEFLDGWECEHDEIAGCVVSLAEEFRERNFWGSADVEAIIQWISDLKKIGAVVIVDDGKVVAKTQRIRRHC